MREIRQEQETRDPVECESRFRERMEKLVPTFLDIREKMGVGEDVGFGYLPEAHGSGDSLGSLPEIKRTKRGDIKYSVSGLLGRMEQDKLPKEQEKNILVMPKEGKKLKVVSVWDRYNDRNVAPSPRLIDTIDDDVFVGLIVHELAHTYGSKSELPPDMRSVLEAWYKDNDGQGKWRPGKNLNQDAEQEMDLIASLLGYKDQVIAKIDFMMARLKAIDPSIEEPSKYPEYLLEPKDQNSRRMFSELKNRRDGVLKYCP